MNLISDPWIPVKYSDGRRTRVAAVDISDAGIAQVLAPRRDFTGALYQLLIGLLQTYFAPRSADEWKVRYQMPPTREELIEAFDPEPFELFSDRPGKPAFMQDFDELVSRSLPIGGLIIDEPGAQGIKRNTDHFVHRGGCQALCRSCASSAIFTIQTNAPSGGKGHRTGMRGGGPLTTLVFSDLEMPSLWKDLWLNVIIADPTKISQSPIVAPEQIDASVLPWLGPTKTSERDQTVSPTPEAGVHYLQAYWGMPRRIRLISDNKRGVCDICGEVDESIVSQYQSQNYGYNYSEAWRHPLTPYTVTNDNSSAPNPKKGRPGALAYPDYQWISGMTEFAYSPNSDKTMVVPAEVIRDVQRYKIEQSDPLRRFRVWVFGYDMDNMKPRGWLETRMPLYAMPMRQMEKVARTVRDLVDVAITGENQLRRAVLEVAANDAKNKIGGSSWADQVSGEFYSLTERTFFLVVESVVSDSSHENSIRHLREWANSVRYSIERLFFQAIGVAPDDRMPIDRNVYEVHSRMLRYFLGSKVVKTIRERNEALNDSPKEEV